MPSGGSQEFVRYVEGRCRSVPHFFGHALGHYQRTAALGILAIDEATKDVDLEHLREVPRDRLVGTFLQDEQIPVFYQNVLARIASGVVEVDADHHLAPSGGLANYTHQAGGRVS